jgi:hypothetical protein
VTTLVIVALGLIVACVVVFLLRKKGVVPRSADAQGIDRLMKAGSDLTRVHEIESLFYFPSRASAENVSPRLQGDGYKVSIEEGVRGPRSVLRATRSMVPLVSELPALRLTFDELAVREGGIYDDWKVEVVR